MMVSDCLERLLKSWNGSDNDGSHHRVLTDRIELFVGEKSWFTENTIWDTDFANIVQKGCHLQSMLRLLVKIQVDCDLNRVAHHIFGMASCVTIFIVYSRYQGIEHQKSLVRMQEKLAQTFNGVVIAPASLCPHQTDICGFQDDLFLFAIFGKDGETGG